MPNKSFWGLINEYRIIIPVIQRDYAQGRDNPRARDVRKKIIGKMVEALTPQHPCEFFDFVYGRIEDSGENNIKKFIPFDGQQRLTTLFLLHKYIFNHCRPYDYEESLLHFSYATRQSSREFCEKLIKENILPLSQTEKISDFIKDQSWFFSDWEKDPTIMGMLTVLDEINRQMIDRNDFNAIACRLKDTQNCPIIFNFVDMGELKLPDDVYIKMNARGKNLTPFENFKANLEQYLQSPDDQIRRNILKRMKEKIDVDWLELFWCALNHDDNQGKKIIPDPTMLSFVNRHFANVWQLWYAKNYPEEQNGNNLSDDAAEQKKRCDDINTRVNNEFPLYPDNESFVSWDIYADIIDFCGIKDCIVPIFNIWDALCKNATDIQRNCQAIWDRNIHDGHVENRWDLFSGKISQKNKDGSEIETYPSRVIFYALMRFFTTINQNIEISELGNWMRVVWNIVENAAIEHPSDMTGAMGLIYELSENQHCYDILSFLSSVATGKNKITSNFARDQVREEYLKAWLITQSNDFLDAETTITSIERKKCFTGRIISMMLKCQNIHYDRYANTISTDDLVDIQRLQIRIERLNSFFVDHEQDASKMIGKILLKYGDGNNDYCIDAENNQWLFINSYETLIAFLHNRKKIYDCPIVIFSKFLDGKVQYDDVQNNNFGKRDWKFYFYKYFLSDSYSYRYGWSDNIFSIEALPGDSGRSTHYSPYLAAIAEWDNETYQYQQGRGNRRHSDGRIHIGDNCEMWIECEESAARFKVCSRQELEILSGNFLGQNDGYYIYTVDFDGDVISQGRQLLGKIKEILSGK